MKHLIVSNLVFLILLLFSGNSIAAGKKDYDTWTIHVLFKIGTDAWDDDPSQVTKWIQTQIETAEVFFSDSPRLKIIPSYVRVKTLGGQDTSILHFRRSSKYKKWMDKYADNKASSKTEGHVTVLVVDEICLGNSKRKKKRTGEEETCWAGISWLPHWVTPFKRKTGIILRYNSDAHTLAHEIGHFLGLKHTFKRYVGLANNSNCNSEYRKAHCSTCRGANAKGGQCPEPGTSNLMDYCSATRMYLNDCQKRRAAAQRRIYMTRDGETNYRKLTGRR